MYTNLLGIRYSVCSMQPVKLSQSTHFSVMVIFDFTMLILSLCLNLTKSAIFQWVFILLKTDKSRHGN